MERRPSAQNDTGVLEHGVYTLEAVVSSVDWEGSRRKEASIKGTK